MRHSSYVFNTWLLAQVFNPLFFYSSFLLTGDPVNLLDLAFISLVSLVFSAPSLLVQLSLFSLLLTVYGKDHIKFFIWLIVLALSILANLLLLFLAFGEGPVATYSLQLCLPAALAAWFSAVTRYKLFIKRVREQDLQ